MKKVYIKIHSRTELEFRMKNKCQKLDFIEYNISNIHFETHYKIQDISYDDIIVLLNSNNLSYDWVKWDGKTLDERY